MNWNQLSEELKNKFTMGGDIPKYDWMAPGNGLGGSYYDKSVVEESVQAANRRDNTMMGSYHQTSIELFDCLDKYPIKDKEVAIVGSVTPWHEGVCLAWGGKPITIEYNKVETNDERLSTMTVDEWKNNPRKFDVVFSISSYEHDGLGRYGDPINPDGDLEAMANCRDNMLEDGGLLYLAVPLGGDLVCWNAHRRYGSKRWPLLIDGFEVVYSMTCPDGQSRLDKCLAMDLEPNDYVQPAVVLRKK